MESINGLVKCQKIIFEKDGFVIAKFSAAENTETLPKGWFTIKGNIFVKEGEEYIATGNADKKTSYEDSYDAVRVAKNIDLSKATKTEIKTFLSSVLSESKASLVVESLEDPVDVLENRKLSMLTDIKGIGVATAEKIIDVYYSQKDFSYAYVELAKYNLTTSAISKLCKRFSSPEALVDLIKNNPYELTKIEGYGFSKADSIFLSDPSNKPTDNRRVEAYIKYMFEKEYEEGNTWISPIQFIEKLREFIPDANMRYAVEYVNTSKDYTTLTMTDGSQRVTTTKMVKMEESVVKELDRLLSNKTTMKFNDYSHHIEKVEKANGWQYDESQRTAIDEMVEKNVYMLQGLGGTGKAMPVWLEVPTPNGKKRLGDIKIGDYVFDRFGKPTEVTGVFPQGMKDSYEVLFADGRKTWCNDEHLWTTYTSKNNFKTRSLREMLDMGLYHGTSDYRQAKFKIPVANAVEYAEVDLPVDPYVVGAFLGDGSTTSKLLTICSDDEFVVKEVSRIIDAKCYKKNSVKNFSWSFSMKNPVSRPSAPTKSYFHTKDIFGGLSEVTRLSHEKRIPKRYMYSSYEQRMSLVQGLMDTDGSINDSPRAGVSYTTTSINLANDLKELLGSLGYHSSIGVNRREGKRDCYDISVNIPNSEKPKIFRLPRRKDVAVKHSNKTKYRDYTRVGIREVKKMKNQEEMVCIMVDNPEHLFLANDFIVTHNTSVVKGFASTIHANGYSVAQCCLSGKAADNLARSTGYRASTIHSLLGVGMGENGGFKYNKEYPLPSNVVVLDELSMVSIDIFLPLLKAIRTGSKLIMIGDYGQLEAIGVGVMGGMIRSKSIPMSLLKKIHRQAQNSAIITHSISIRSGKKPKELKLDPDTTSVYGVKKDLEYVLVNDEEEDKISTHTIFKFKEALSNFDIEDIQILCSTRNLTFILNKNAQMVYNPAKKGDMEVVLGFKDKYYIRVGDKVINMKNNRDTKGTNGMPTPIFNGNTGIVKAIEDDGEGEHSLVIDFDGIGEVIVEGDAMNRIELGYAATVHKCVTEDTWIYTDKGIKQIGDINNGASVGEFKKITIDIGVYNGYDLEKPSAFYNAGESPIKRIVTNKGYELNGTDEHGVDILRHGRMERVRIDELSVGDRLAISMDNNVFGNNTDLPKEWLDRPRQDVRTIKYSRPDKMTKDFARFLGYMVADGTIAARTIKFSKRNREVTEDFRNIVYRLFGYYKEHMRLRPSGDHMYEVTSTDIVNYCKNIEGLQPHEKYVPKCILEASEECQREFLKTVFEDGSVNVQKGRFDHIEFSAKKELLVDQMRMMLLNMGIITTKKMRRKKKDGKFHESYYIYIYKFDSRVYDKKIGFISYDKRQNLSLCHVDYGHKQDNTLIDDYYGKLFIDEIVSIEDDIANTYCLEMPNTHKFIQNGIHAYNCQGSTIKCVIFALPFHFLLNTKELVYTGMTRASQYQVLVTSPKSFKRALRNTSVEKKQVNLSELLLDKIKDERTIKSGL